MVREPSAAPRPPPCPPRRPDCRRCSLRYSRIRVHCGPGNRLKNALPIGVPQQWIAPTPIEGGNAEPATSGSSSGGSQAPDRDTRDAGFDHVIGVDRSVVSRCLSAGETAQTSTIGARPGGRPPVPRRLARPFARSPAPAALRAAAPCRRATARRVATAWTRDGGSRPTEEPRIALRTRRRRSKTRGRGIAGARRREAPSQPSRKGSAIPWTGTVSRAAAAWAARRGRARYSRSYRGPSPPSGVTQVITWYGSMIVARLAVDAELAKSICRRAPFGRFLVLDDVVDLRRARKARARVAELGGAGA